MKWLDPAWWHGMETLVGLQCPADPEGDYNILRLRKDQERIHIEASVAYAGQAAMCAALDRLAKLPIVLVLADTMVMERILPADAAANPVFAVLGVGVGDTSEFEVMRFPAEGGRISAALIRKETIETYCERLGPHKARVVTAIYSPAVCMYVLPQALPDFLERNVTLEIHGKTLAFKQGLLCPIDELAAQRFIPLTAQDLGAATATQPSDALLYASLLYAWLQSAARASEMPMATQWRDYQAISRLRQMAVVASLALFVGFACLASLRIQGERRKAELESQYSQNLPVLNAIQQLDEKIAAREDLGNRLGSQTLKPSRASYYLDRIAAVMPPEMHLLEAIIGPDEEDFKRQGIREVQAKEIILRGECLKSAPIAQYSEALQNIPGIGSLVVQRSEINFQTGLYEFIFLANFTTTNLDR
jgi:hypothetical protein